MVKRQMGETLDGMYQRLAEINRDYGDITEHALVRSHALHYAMYLIELHREVRSRQSERCRGLCQVEYDDTECDFLLNGLLSSAKFSIQGRKEAVNNKKTYQVWVEGYCITGQSERADYYGTYQAETFEDAVIMAAKKHNLSLGQGRPLRNYFGCRFYDNEQDARRSHG